jgi:pSer/pThr/pTyr-binding forkhead associated (FHA) protein
VSRYHVELRYLNNQWKLISFGNNGTYLQGKLVKEAVVEDGTIIGLALSGPQLQINLGLTAQALNPNQVSVHHPLSNQSLGQPRNTFIREPDA